MFPRCEECPLRCFYWITLSGELFTSISANCPHAAITSRPREYRTNAGTPLSVKAF
jgi:hypothetical protein